MQAVFLPGCQLKIFLAQLKTCPRFSGIYDDTEGAANAAWRALEEHFGELSLPQVHASERHPDETAFLTRIFEDPDEDTTRLVFADWLEENGQPDKAAFVRLEVALSQVPKNETKDEGMWAELVRLDGAISGHWTMSLIRPARNVEWLFRCGQFSSYDVGLSRTSRYALTLDAQRMWHFRKYDCVPLAAEDRAQIKRLTNVPEVEDALAKLPQMPRLDLRDR